MGKSTDKPYVEIEDTKDIFRFRLVNGNRQTTWASYTTFCYLDGYVAATEYYLPSDMALTAITSDEFCKIVGVR